MSIPVFKPQHVRWLPDHTRLWAVYEGVDGRHHEEAHEYTHEHRTEYTTVGTLYGHTIPQTQFVRREPAEHPLLTSDYREDHTQVLPGTLRFIRLEDVTKLYRYVLKTGEMFVFHWDGYTPGGAVYDRMRTLNGFEISQEDLTFAHIIYPHDINTNEHLVPDEWGQPHTRSNR